MEGEKERYYEDPESSNVCKFLCQDKNMKKRNIAKILNKKKRIQKKHKYAGNLRRKRKYEKKQI